MKPFLVLLFVIFIWLATTSILLAQQYAKTGCPVKCGSVEIPYPFGIGSNCSLHSWYTVDCNSSIPYLPAINNVEVLNVNLTRGTVLVDISVKSDCQNLVWNTSQIISNFDLESSPFLFSDLDNILVVEGCGLNGFITDIMGTTVTGCSTTCLNDTVSDRNNCFGIGCCQATIPHKVKSFVLNLEGLERHLGDGRCGSTFLVDRNFSQQSISMNHNRSIPLSLSWTLSPDDLYEIQDFSVVECILYALDLGNGNWVEPMKCTCRITHNGNPYLANGCEGISISMGLLLLMVIGYALYKVFKETKAKRRKKMFFKRNGGLLLKQQESADTNLVNKTILFTSSELEKATNNFNENRILGRGGQGTVYKGMLIDGRIVAIKKSKVVDESQLEQFINEVVVLSQVNHRNVVKLLGCCLETEVPLLVSEFVSNGTLYHLIHDNTREFPVSLNMRLQIATEVAGALSYLHSASSIPIYHRDIKTTNILLDDHYRAKVSDFGTSRFVSIGQTHLTTLVKGTFGYFDPEYFQSSHFTEKSDVYSFGVVLLEFLTREKPISLTRFGEHRNLATHFMFLMEEGRGISIFDSMLLNESKNELLGIANLAMRCLSPNGRNRPTMKQVAIDLEGMRMSHVPTTG
uniref:wall-associated receptor kinase-like 1 n=1 Tax=Erigeron canadensis TaxID=72917 RepID=UPI001CB9D316|nr:wall-associated receptor kinase-like 1 [Erigeron canadensis]